jgi:hypothetical protein
MHLAVIENDVKLKMFGLIVIRLIGLPGARAKLGLADLIAQPPGLSAPRRGVDFLGATDERR